MTRDGLTEENLRDGSVKDISHRSRGRPENKEEFVPERERKKAENEDSKSGKGKRLQMEKIRKSSVRQEAVEDTVEVTPEEKVSGYRKKLHRYEKIPDDDNNLNSQKKSIRKKQLQKQMTKEQAKAGRLSFDDEGNQMVKGAGMKPGGTAGKYIATQAVISGMKAVTSEEEETDENAGVESARLAERETEAALRGLRHAQIRSKRTDVKTHRRGYREANNTFYIVIDRSATSQNVYMLSQIDENDLSEFLDKDSTATVVTPQPDKSKVVLDETNNEDVDKEATIDPEKTASAKTNMGAMATILILALGGVAAYYYFKIYKPKKEEDEDDQPEGLETGGLEEVPDEEESEDEDFEENEK